VRAGGAGGRRMVERVRCRSAGEVGVGCECECECELVRVRFGVLGFGVREVRL